jgi:hypothetical protein
MSARDFLVVQGTGASIGREKKLSVAGRQAPGETEIPRLARNTRGRDDTVS